MIQVSSENNQLKVVVNGVAEFYSFIDIKSFSPLSRAGHFKPGQTPERNWFVSVNFINENKNSPLLLDLSKIDNQGAWTNDATGAAEAVSDLSEWSNNAVNNIPAFSVEPATSAVPPTYTSGLLTVGAIYTITTYETGDDFTNVGALSNANGVEFEATGTTPTDWSNGSLLTKGFAGDEITDWDAADDFETEAISFVGRDKTLPFSFQIVDYNITPGTPTLTMLVSINGTDFTNYNSNTTDIDITDTDNNAFFSSAYVAFEYIKFVYTSGGSTGSFSLVINK